MFWECSWSLHFVVVHNKLFLSGNGPPLVLSQDQHKWNHTCKIEVGGHDETSSVVHIYPQFCIVLSLFFLFITLLWFDCKNLQRIFPPISENNYFSSSFCFLICIVYVFNCLAYISLCFRFISRLLFMLFPIRAISFSSTVKMSYFY